jgi:hypothetical protein
LSENESLPWSLELIRKYKDKWNWSNLSKNKLLPWSIELIYEFENKWNWRYLSENKSVPFSIELIDRYAKKWIWSSYTFRNIVYSKIMAPYLDDALLDEIMEVIVTKQH